MNNYEKLARIAVDKSLLKEYSDYRTVYMDNNTEFQIQLFNPYDYVIGVSFDFNGTHKSSSLLVLKPGERVWLDKSKKAIKNNGNINIEFYKEKVSNLYYSSWTSIYPNKVDYPKTIDIWYSATSATTANTLTNFNNTLTASCVNTSIETGRIEKGSHSNQRFKNVDTEFEIFPFKTEYIKILPTSQKTITSDDIKKRYCHECGKKISAKFKYCPNCGSKQ